ncbi:MAG: hypothetical protein ACTMUB_07480 [cyanobacterium endosymbiont of Rhopalodia musculus]|nr:hypothetical protein [cyanobacterium endosymbiont of Epithemia clementina EcSB]WGT67932.1 hypothetical protein P3F56_02285 [cyanobacterium endosymbiont of Epithemia clementina EcSB]
MVMTTIDNDMEILELEDSWIVIWSQPKTMTDNTKKLVTNAIY